MTGIERALRVIENTKHLLQKDFVTPQFLKDVLEAMKSGDDKEVDLECMLDMLRKKCTELERQLQYFKNACALGNSLRGDEMAKLGRRVRELAHDLAFHASKPSEPEQAEKPVCLHDWRPVFIPTQTGAIRHDCYKCGESQPCVYDGKPTAKASDKFEVKMTQFDPEEDIYTEKDGKPTAKA
jgi:hypothetical protein